VSEELENSLRQAVETYLNDRLRGINEQVSRLQSELERLRESTGNQSLEGTALSAAIFAHLQTARGQKLSGPMKRARAASLNHFSGILICIPALRPVRRVFRRERIVVDADILGLLLSFRLPRFFSLAARLSA